MKNGKGGLGRQRVILQSFKYRNWIYSLESIPCQKPNCEKCPHGAYWYIRGLVKEKKETFYLGGRLQIVSWEIEKLGGLTFEELYRGRKERAQKKRDKEISRGMERDRDKRG